MKKMSRRYLVNFFILILLNNCQSIINCAYTSHPVNTKGITAYVNILTKIVQGDSSLFENSRNADKKFNIKLEKLEKINREFNNITNTYIHTDRTNLFQQVNFFSQFEKLINNFEVRYKKFQSNLFDITTSNINDEFYTNLLYEYSEKNDHDLKEIRKRILPKIRNNITAIFSLKAHNNICDHNYSLVKLYFYINLQLIMVELKSFLTETFIYLVYKYYPFASNKSHQPNISMFNNYNKSTSRLRSNLNDYQRTLLNYAKSYSTNDLYGCTLSEPIREKETLEFHGVFQTFVALEPDITPDGSCTYSNCLFPVFKNKSTFKISLEGYRQTKPCHGLLTECKLVDEIEICYADDSSSKRYEGLKFNNEIYGNMTLCTNGKSKIQSWRRWIVNTCDLCICTCSVFISDHNDNKSQGAISLMEETSDIMNNMVVTNVKFVEQNNIIYMQIEQTSLSQLKDNKTYSENKWKPLNNSWDNMTISLSTNINSLDDKILPGAGISYEQIHYLISSLYLDDVILPPGYVVTGIKFGLSEINMKRKAIHLQVRATLYDLINNQLIITYNNESTSYWIDATTMDLSKMPEYQRNRTILKPFYSEKSNDPPVLAFNIKDSVPNKAILFRASGLRDDAGQSTIPYFDSRATMSKWPLPLSGIGISLKGYDGTNGYLTLKTIPYSIPPIN